MSERAWYRVEGYGTPYIRELPVIRFTPQGVWLHDSYGGYGREPGERFVLRNALKRFACPTKLEAIRSFEARRRREIRILKGKILKAEEALSAAERLGGVWDTTTEPPTTFRL